MDSENLNLTQLQKFITQTKDNHKTHQENHAFLKIVLGKFMIQTYRVFKYLPEDNAIILFKRQQSKTKYIFFMILNNISMLRSFFINQNYLNQNPIKKMKSLIEKIKRKPEQNYSISIGLIQEIKKLTFRSEKEFQNFLQYCKNQEKINKVRSIINGQQLNSSPQEKEKAQSLSQYPEVECFVPYFSKQNEEVLFQTRQQIQDLKQMLTTYIDTFANKQKGGLIYKMIERSLVSFSINRLLNTINYIIFEEMNNSCYSQIEPCYWTCYQSSKRQLNSDRKHIVLSGSGQICVLQIIFMRQIQSEDRNEYEMMLADFKKFYKKAKIKIFRITNQKWDGSAPSINLEDEQNVKANQNECLIYKFHSTLAREFPPSQR